MKQVLIISTLILANVGARIDQISLDPKENSGCANSSSLKSSLELIKKGARNPEMLIAKNMQLSSVAPNCLVECSQTVNPYPESWCRSEGSDCDGFFGINESYQYDRTKVNYTCPGNKAYVWCSEWGQADCCNNGSSGALPPCGADQRKACASTSSTED